jgi:hypothetical protein
LKKGCLIALGIPLGLVILLVTLVWLNYYALHVRYRLTVEVQDGDQVKSGSSVIDASYYIDPGWIWEGPHNYFGEVLGYAPTVDLGEKGMLFLTFDQTQTPEQMRERGKQNRCSFGVIGCLPFAAYNKSGVWQDDRERNAILKEMARQIGPRDVPLAMLPRLGRFRDMSEPLSLTLVSPYDLAASFGPGVELRRVILQITNDSVTPPPAAWPQWLTKKGYTYDYDRILFHVPRS